MHEVIRHAIGKNYVSNRQLTDKRMTRRLGTGAAYRRATAPDSPFMNINNALGFLVLGLLMYTTPVLAESFSGHPAVVESSVRTLWLEFMGWVISSIGSGYVLREGMSRAPALLTYLVPARFLRPIMARGEARIPAGARVSVSS